jgi:hypothetical protein
MDADDRTRTVVEEIRDAQREHLAEYRRVAQQSLDLQQRVADRQQELGRLYRRIVLLGGGSVGVLVLLLAHLLVRWSHHTVPAGTVGARGRGVVAVGSRGGSRVFGGPRERRGGRLARRARPGSRDLLTVLEPIDGETALESQAALAAAPTVILRRCR